VSEATYIESSLEVDKLIEKLELSGVDVEKSL